MKINRLLKIIIIFLSLTVRVECDMFNELLVSVKKLHDKMNKIDFELTKTNKKVDKVQNDLNMMQVALLLSAFSQ